MRTCGTPFITIVIPVYKVPKVLDRLLKGVLNCDYKKKEIIVVADEPNDETIEILNKYRNKIVSITNSYRRGKVEALNEGIRRGKGDIFLFIDNDIYLPDDSKDFLDVLVEEMGDVDIAEINKEVVKDTFWSRLVYYDHVSFQMANWIFSKTMKKTLGVNGAIFAAKREVFEKIGLFKKTISEDLDFALRAFKNNLKFKFITRLKVYNVVYSDLQSWYNQRKRWAYGVASWVNENLLDLISILKRYPHIIIPVIYLTLPTLIFTAVTLYTPASVVVDISNNIPMRFIPAINAPFFFLTLFPWLPMLMHISETIWAFIFYSIIFFILSRKMKFKFNILEFALYFFIYAPIWLAILLYGFVRVFVFPEKQFDIDWKV